MEFSSLVEDVIANEGIVMVVNFNTETSAE